MTTMAEIDWDDDKHCLAEVQHESGNYFVMLAPLRTGVIKCVSPDGNRILYASALRITPTGKRYSLN